MIDGLIRVIETLASNINKNVVLIGMAMILIFMLGTTTGVTEFMTCILLITGLAVVFTVFQTVVQIKMAKYRIDKEEELKAKKK